MTPALLRLESEPSARHPLTEIEDVEMDNQEQRQTASEIGTDDVEYVFAGIGTKVESAGNCDDECVGGTANTQAMQATMLS